MRQRRIWPFEPWSGFLRLLLLLLIEGSLGWPASPDCRQFGGGAAVVVVGRPSTSHATVLLPPLELIVQVACFPLGWPVCTSQSSRRAMIWANRTRRRTDPWSAERQVTTVARRAISPDFAKDCYAVGRFAQIMRGGSTG